MDKVAFHFSIADITAHYLDVTLSFTPPNTDPILLTMPAWIPGSYLIRNFAKHVVAISAKDSLGELEIHAHDKHSWQLKHNAKPVTVSYRVYAYDLSVRACYINDEVAVLNPAACCLAVTGLTERPHQLVMVKVQGKPDWHCATGLKRAQGTELLGFGEYLADNYLQLIDSPLLLGKLTMTSFDLEGVRHYQVYAGAVLADLDRVKRDLAPVCAQQIALFGALPADLTEYWFLNWVVDNGYGGLEHHNSTLLLLSRYDLPNPQQPDELSDDYQNYLALCSHEYFHTWWVKRAKPASFLQYQLQAEQYTSQLWLYEGFTSYYDDLALVRAGVTDASQYLNTLAKTISRVSRAPSNNRQSLSDSSFSAWTKFYQQDENAINAVVSYYAKGSLVALCLDAELRASGLSLDALMQQCWHAFGVSGLGSEEQDFWQQLMLYSQNPGLTEKVRRWVEHPEVLPLGESLQKLGVKLDWRGAHSPQDLSGKAQSGAPRAFGALYQSNNEGLQITAVAEGSAASAAGLMAGDLLIAVAGLKANDKNFQAMLSRHPLGAHLELHLFRQQRLLKLQLEVCEAPQVVAMLEVDNDTVASAWLKQASLLKTTPETLPEMTSA